MINQFLLPLVTIMIIYVFSCEQAAQAQKAGNDGLQDLTNNFLQYQNPNHSVNVQYPYNWKVETSDDKSFEFLSPSIEANLTIDVTSSIIPLNQLISANVMSYKQQLSEFKLLDSGADIISGNVRAYKVVFSYKNGDHFYQVMRIWARIADKAYYITYSSELDKYYYYLSTIQKMINSIGISVPSPFGKGLSAQVQKAGHAGLSTGSQPYDITVDPSTDRLYVANLLSNTLSVIDGTTDRVLTNIDVGSFPSSVSLNSGTKKLYVANSGSDTVSVIDLSTYKKIADVAVGDKPIDLTIDPNLGSLNSLVFIADSGSNIISVMDGLRNKIVSNITVGNGPDSVVVNPLTKRLYVANSGSNTVSVIDYFVSKTGQFNKISLTEIGVGSFPINVKLDTDTNILYVANSGSNTVSVINGSTNNKITDLSVGSFPAALYVNPYTNFMYITNYGSSTVSVIDITTNKRVADIPVGGSPLAISFNPASRILYVTNLYFRTLSEISDNEILAGVSFNIKPPNAGNIECNQKKVLNNDYVRYPAGKFLYCKATANSGFLFSSWSSDFLPPSNNTESVFRISQFGNLTANFIIPVQVSFPKAYWEGLYVVLLSVIIPAAASWFIPAIASWLNSWRRRRNLSECMKTIIKLHDQYKDDGQYLERLEEKREDIAHILTEGKISESQYDILDKKISDYEEKVKKL